MEYSIVQDGPTSDIMLWEIRSVFGSEVAQALSPGPTKNPSGWVGDPSPLLEMDKEESFWTHNANCEAEEAPRSTEASSPLLQAVKVMVQRMAPIVITRFMV